MDRFCVLSGLIIPQEKANREHYCCRHRFPKSIWNNPNNIFWAHYMLNAIKADYIPCEWSEMKFELTYNAIHHWRMPEEDREFLQQAIKNWEIWNPNPCTLCLAKCRSKKR